MLHSVPKFDLSFLADKGKEEKSPSVLRTKMKFFLQEQVITQCKRGIRTWRSNFQGAVWASELLPTDSD